MTATVVVVLAVGTFVSFIAGLLIGGHCTFETRITRFEEGDEWRDEGAQHGYQLVHNPETCDLCYAAQLERDSKAAP